jgi:hypothetical protein
MDNFKTMMRQIFLENDYVIEHDDEDINDQDHMDTLVKNFYKRFPNKNPNDLKFIKYSDDDIANEGVFIFYLDDDIVLHSYEEWEMIIKIELSTTKIMINVDDDSWCKHLKLLPESLPNISYTFYVADHLLIVVEPSLFLKSENSTLVKRIYSENTLHKMSINLENDIVLEILSIYDDNDDNDDNDEYKYGSKYKIIKNGKVISGFKSDMFATDDYCTDIYQTENKICIMNHGDSQSIIVINIHQE